MIWWHQCKSFIIFQGSGELDDNVDYSGDYGDDYSGYDYSGGYGGHSGCRQFIMHENWGYWIDNSFIFEK